MGKSKEEPRYMITGIAGTGSKVRALIIARAMQRILEGRSINVEVRIRDHKDFPSTPVELKDFSGSLEKIVIPPIESFRRGRPFWDKKKKSTGNRRSRR
jgi:hypothetical protein